MLEESLNWYYASKVAETYCTPGMVIMLCLVAHSSSNGN